MSVLTTPQEEPGACRVETETSTFQTRFFHDLSCFMQVPTSGGSPRLCPAVHLGNKAAAALLQTIRHEIVHHADSTHSAHCCVAPAFGQAGVTGATQPARDGRMRAHLEVWLCLHVAVPLGVRAGIQLHHVHLQQAWCCTVLATSCSPAVGLSSHKDRQPNTRQQVQTP